MKRHERMTRKNPNTPAPEAIIIKMSTPTRLVAHGDEGVPTGVPAKNHGAVVAIDPHQTAAAAVMAGMHTATETASTPRTLTWPILMLRCWLRLPPPWSTGRRSRRTG